MNEEAKKNELIEIGGLWERQSSTGEVFYSGNLGNARLLIFRNRYKTADKQPDYRMYVTRRQRPEQTGRLADTASDPLASDADDENVTKDANREGDAPAFP